MKQIIISHWKFSFTYVKLEDFMTFHDFFLNSIFYYKNEC
jgi:hypothetical protein